MKIIKFVMSKGSNISLPIEKAELVLNSESQIVKITNEKGDWTGETINKSFLVCTEIDRDGTQDLLKEAKMIQNSQLLNQPKQENSVPVSELLKKYKPTLG